MLTLVIPVFTKSFETRKLKFENPYSIPFFVSVICDICGFSVWIYHIYGPLWAPIGPVSGQLGPRSDSLGPRKKIPKPRFQPKNEDSFPFSAKNQLKSGPLLFRQQNTTFHVDIHVPVRHIRGHRG